MGLVYLETIIAHCYLYSIDEPRFFLVELFAYKQMWKCNRCAANLCKILSVIAFYFLIELNWTNCAEIATKWLICLSSIKAKFGFPIKRSSNYLKINSIRTSRQVLFNWQPEELLYQEVSILMARAQRRTISIYLNVCKWFKLNVPWNSLKLNVCCDRIENIVKSIVCVAIDIRPANAKVNNS